jgi:hypothetical protein
MSTKIRVRSPYYLRFSDLNLHYVDIELFTSFTVQSVSGTADYTLKKYEKGSDNYVTVEVAELVRDFLEERTKFEGTYDTDDNRPIWLGVKAKIYNSADPPVQQGSDVTEYYLCFNAYSDFEDGINNVISDTTYVLNSASKLRKPDGVSIAVALNSEAIDDGTTCKAAFYNGGTKVAATEVTVDSTTAASSKITFVESGANDVDELRIYQDTTGANTLLHTLPVITQECSRFDPIKLTFYNKFGALQDLFFFSKLVSSLKVQSEEFKASNLTLSTSPPTYDTYKHQYNTFDKQGKESITLNSGIVGDEYNESMRELMLSEKVWMTKDSTVYPVKITSTNFTEKTSLNNKAFNYTIQLEYAFDKVQNIR